VATNKNNSAAQHAPGTDNFWNNLPSSFTNEASVEHLLIVPLITALGYERADYATKVPVVFQRGQVGRPNEADYVVFGCPVHDNDNSLFVVEAKHPGRPIGNAKSQGESYAFALRTPVLITTNGISFEIWQLQPTQQSQCVFCEPVADLAKHRGTIESILSKPALIQYCKSILAKPIQEFQSDYSPYFYAELARIQKWADAITRTLRPYGDHGAAGLPSTDNKLLQIPGAIILASSGMGKTTLAFSFLRLGIEALIKGNSQQIPFFINLLDIEATGESLIDYACSRMAAHCPGVTPAVFQDICRNAGLLLICDTFDRLSVASRAKIVAELEAISRDHPKSTLIVLSRPSAIPALQLASYELLPLSNDEIRLFGDAFIKATRGNTNVYRPTMSALIRELAKYPLILELLWKSWNKNGRFPTDLKEIFEFWIESLFPENMAPTRKLRLIDTLTAISQSLSEGRRSLRDICDDLSAAGYSTADVDELHALDAIDAKQSLVQIRHEAMADYLRAKAISQFTGTNLSDTIDRISLSADSFFPALLISVLPDRLPQQQLWNRIARLDPRTYINALRYAPDLSDDLLNLDDNAFQIAVLEDLQKGVELPLAGLFPALMPHIERQFVGVDNERISVEGTATRSAELHWRFLPRSNANGQLVTVKFPDINTSTTIVHFSGMAEYRVDQGRLHGAALLYEALARSILNNELVGGPIFTEERVIARLRLVASKGVDVNLTSNLDIIEAAIAPYSDRAVTWGSSVHAPYFEIQSLLKDIRTLRDHGLSRLSCWWAIPALSARNNIATPIEIQNYLQAMYARATAAYKEVAEASFGRVLKFMAFYPSLPVKWKIGIYRPNRDLYDVAIEESFIPVANESQAGVDAAIASDSSDFRQRMAETKAALICLKRYGPNTSIWMGQSIFPMSHGREPNGVLSGCTAALRMTRSLLLRDLDALFTDLPSKPSQPRI